LAQAQSLPQAQVVFLAQAQSLPQAQAALTSQHELEVVALRQTFTSPWKQLKQQPTRSQPQSMVSAPVLGLHEAPFSQAHLVPQSQPFGLQQQASAPDLAQPGQAFASAQQGSQGEQA
jgi:hypothetical protein